MPGFLLNAGAMVQCAHLGQAKPMTPNPRVLVSSQPTVTTLSPYVVAGCTLSGTGTPPCVAAQWTLGATKLFSNGAPLVLQDSQSLCTPTGTPLVVLLTQVRAAGM